MDFKMVTIGTCFMVTWVIFKKPPLGGRPNTKLETMALQHLTLLCSNHVWGPRMNRNSLKYQLIKDLVTYDFTLHLRACDHTPWFWKCLETTFGHFFWALIVSWSRVLTRVWSGPKPRYPMPISKLDDFSHLRQFLSNPKTFIELQIKFLHPSNIEFPTLLVKSNTTYVFSTTLL